MELMEQGVDLIYQVQLLGEDDVIATRRLEEWLRNNFI